LTNAGASSPNEPCHARIHLFLFDPLATSDLIDSQLHLSVEPSLVGEKAIHSIDNQFVRAAAGARGKAGELCGLAFWKLKIHFSKLGVFAPTVKGRPGARALRVESLQAQRFFAALTSMSRTFYVLAAALGLFALISAGMALVPSSFQPGLPANGSLWRTVAMFLLLFGLASALIGVLSHLFEQVDRRSEESRLAARRKRRSGQ